MIGLGITQVRIGEFAWSRLEPTPRKFNIGLARPCDRYVGKIWFEGDFMYPYRDTTKMDDQQIP